VIPATDLAPFGSHRFRIPFDASRKKWIRFAAWDSAGEGAMAQPVKLISPVGGTSGALAVRPGLNRISYGQNTKLAAE
jgi:hypothetical protein